MFDKWKKYSYAAQKYERYRMLLRAFIVIGVYVLYQSLTSFIVSVWSQKNDSMQPGMVPGDRLVLVSFTIPSLLSDIKLRDSSLPFKRGHIVLIDTGLKERRRLSRNLLDGLVRFGTAQRRSLYNEEQYFFRRVVGLPGDEISMTNFVLRVKPSGDSFNLTEFELAERPYFPNIPQGSALWDESLPFSGNMDPIVLGSGECFVVSDDRSNTNDSRTWGPVSSERIVGRVVFRFWPIMRMGRP